VREGVQKGVGKRGQEQHLWGAENNGESSVIRGKEWTQIQGGFMERQRRMQRALTQDYPSWWMVTDLFKMLYQPYHQTYDDKYK
jgi:hypothetical protein